MTWFVHRPGAVSHAAAQAYDLGLATASEVDLLPACLGAEQGVYRFGQTPWSGRQGPWREPGELWSADAPWTAWPSLLRILDREDPSYRE